MKKLKQEKRLKNYKIKKGNSLIIPNIYSEGDDLMDFFNDEKIKNIIEIIEMLLLVLIIGLLIWDRFFKKVVKEETISEEVPIKEIEKVEEKPITIKEYKVDIKGAVKNPGVYTLNQGSVVNDLIAMAGGIKSGANLKNINLSKKLEDEMVVYVYTTAELNKLKVDTNESKECVCPTYDITPCEGSSVVKVSGSSTNNSDNKSNNENTSTKVNINTDGIDRLTTLTGIGEAKAKAIIEYREKNGGFKSIEEIKNISGIGDASFEKIKDSITI